MVREERGYSIIKESEKQMKEIIVYGFGERGKKAIKNIRKYNDISIIGGYDKNTDVSIPGLERIDLIQEAELYREKAIVICIANKKIVREVYILLRDLGYGDIYCFLDKDRCFGDDFLLDECMLCGEHYEEEIGSVEMHVVDFCNLNCKGCSHFSPIFKKEFPNMDKRINDLVELNQKARIRLIYLLGGEPLLSNELEKYIVEIRRQFNDVIIQVVTNGLLLPQSDDKLLRVLKENNVTVVISEYKPTHTIISKIIDILEKYEIDYCVRKYDKKQKFNMPLSLSGNSKYTKKCISGGCVTVWEGKVACCPTLMYIEHFNETFSQNLPSEGRYNLKDLNCSGSDLCELVYSKVPLCNYCVENSIEWSRCGNPITMEDFAVFD